MDHRKFIERWDDEDFSDWLEVHSYLAGVFLTILLIGIGDPVVKVASVLLFVITTGIIHRPYRSWFVVGLGSAWIMYLLVNLIIRIS